GVIVTAGLGLMLLWAESALVARTDDVRRVTSMAATPPPAVDPQRPRVDAMHPDETAAIDKSSADAAAAPITEQQRLFTAEFAGWMRDTTRVDASQVRLRVFEDGDYFQFFTGTVPNFDL